MVNRRYFKASYERTESETGIGIIENYEDEILLIESIYIDEYLSKRDSLEYILKLIYQKLADNEFAIFKSNKFVKNLGVHYKYNQEIRGFYCNRKGLISDAKALAGDALQRKTTIKETL